MTHSLFSRIRSTRWCWAFVFLLTSCSVKLRAETHYVDMNSGTPVSPYTNWATAAQTIQDAVDASFAGDTVLVTNGVYNTSGRALGTSLLVNRVAVSKPL